MALRRGPQLDDVHRLAGVHLHAVADAVGHGHRVLRRRRGRLAGHRRVELAAARHDPAPVPRRPDVLEGGGLDAAVVRGQLLPLDRQEPMALQVAERAVVGEHVEAVAGPLESAPRPVAAVGAVARAGAQHRGPVGRAQAAGRLEELALGQPGRLVQRRRDHLHLAVRVEVGQGHLGRGGGGRPPEQALRRGGGLSSRIRQVAAPPHPAVLAVDPGEEGGNQLPQLGQHPVRARARLGQRMGPHAQQQGLERLARGEDADVRPGGGGQEPPQRVEGLGPDDRAIHALRVARGVGIPAAEVVLRGLEPPAVGLERIVQGRDVLLAQGQPVDFLGNQVLPAPPGPVGVRHVAGRLLEVRGEPPPLEHLREQVRDALAGDVGGPELGHRVVAVVPEHPLVEAVRPFDADRRLADPAGRHRV